MKSLNDNLIIINKFLIESYELIADQFASNTKIEFKQAYFNLQEKLRYYKVKFEAMSIQISHIVVDDKLEELPDLLEKIIFIIIELYVIIFFI